MSKRFPGRRAALVTLAASGAVVGAATALIDPSGAHGAVQGYSALVLQRAHACAATEAAVLAVDPFEDDDGETPEALAALEATYATLRALAEAPAVTVADVVVKAAVLLPHADSLGEHSRHLLRSLVDDIARVAPELCPLMCHLNPLAEG